jgi:hypothetical protein
VAAPPVKLGDSRLGRFKLGRNRLDLDVDSLGGSRAGAAKSTTQVGVFLLELGGAIAIVAFSGQDPLRTVWEFQDERPSPTTTPMPV